MSKLRCNADERWWQPATLGGAQRMRRGISERGRIDLLTARFGVRIPAPEPNLGIESRGARQSPHRMPSAQCCSANALESYSSDQEPQAGRNFRNQDRQGGKHVDQ